MATILCIETATRNCSVSLVSGDDIWTEEEAAESGYIHAEKLHVFIDKVYKRSAIDLSETDAIAVSSGPGSYTGLRIGVSAAKGLAYALGKPLIAYSTLEALASGVRETFKGCDEYLAMLDARRMEVYMASFDAEGNSLGPVTAEILSPEFFRKFEHDKVCFAGDGVKKASDMISAQHQIVEVLPSAAMAGKLVTARWENQMFESLAYFEPFYLKEFIPGTPKKE